MVSPVELGPTLKRLRESRSMTQADVIAQSHGGISAGHLAQAETGKGTLSLRMCQVLSLAMALTDDEHTELLKAAGREDDGPPINGVYERLAALEERLSRLERRRSKG